MMPPEAQPSPPTETRPDAVAAQAPVPAYHWSHKIWSFVFVTFCAEMGLFLLIFPWTDFWGGNYFSNLFPQMEPLWDNMFVRGAVSGLGVANLYISFAEILRLKGLARQR
jgi:hypothetical protein